MKYVYVVHNNEYSDSENFGAFGDENEAIQVIKELNKQWWHSDMEKNKSLKITSFKDDFDGTTSFTLNSPKPLSYDSDINGKKTPNFVYDFPEYDYYKIPFNNEKAMNKRIDDYF